MSERRTMSRFLCAAVFASCFSLANAAWDGSVRGAAQNPDQTPPFTRAELRKRFESLSEEQKQALRKRLGQFKELSARQRQELHTQTRQLEDMGRRVYRSLPDRERMRLDSLTPGKRQELLREMALAEVQDMGRRILRKLPEGERKRLEAASPQERQRLLSELRGQMDRRIGQTIERMAPALGFSEEELRRLNGLPADERRATFLHVVKRRCAQYVERKGLPEGMPTERWERIRRLPPDEFYLALLNLRREFPSLAWAVHSKGGSDPGRATSRLSPELQRLRRAMEVHLDPAERLELAGKDRAERQHELHRRQRRRVMAELDGGGYLTSGQRKQLEAVPDEAFFSQVRRFLDSGGDKARFPERSPRQGSPKQRPPKSDPPSKRPGGWI